VDYDYRVIFSGLKERDLRHEGILIGEGRLVAARVAASCTLVAILAEPSAAREAETLSAGICPVTVLPTAEIAGLAGYAFHRGLLVAAERPKTRPLVPALEASVKNGDGNCPALEEARRLVVLPEPTDPENLGSIARSALALGWDGLVLGPAACDPWGRRALRCSMGATLALPVYQAGSPLDLSAATGYGWKVLAAENEQDALETGSAALKDWIGEQKRYCVLFGNERDGIPTSWRARCDAAVTIPMPSGNSRYLQSLNVAAAAAIILWELR